jgi:glycosyltransferase involved in cell wall biosynthesis
VKVIALVPVKNEADILPFSLSCLEQFCDHIIVADHLSTDATVDTVKRFAKAQVFSNTTGQEGPEAVWPRLFEAARHFSGENLYLCLDADEFPPPAIFANIANLVSEQGQPGDHFALWWVQLWRSFIRYRSDDSVWSKSYKPIAFFDDRKPLTWGTRELHSGRLPEPTTSSRIVTLEGTPVLHLQWAYWDRTQFKQARYRMIEFINLGFKSAEAINAKYAITLGGQNEGTSAVPEAWLEGIQFPVNLMDKIQCWQFEDIRRMFDEYGVAAFEPLQIWHIEQLKDIFVQRCGRPPVVLVVKDTNNSMIAAAKRRMKTILPDFVIRALRSANRG